jgi:adenosylcobyric acid synthase
VAALSVLGTSSWAGKSLVATALCRWFAQRGVRVAPFKAQNMSNNARVVADGEIGAAQYLQALACGIVPDARMNPVLVKPEADDRSQVVLRGRVDETLSERPWRERAAALGPVVEESLRSLLSYSRARAARLRPTSRTSTSQTFTRLSLPAPVRCS